MTLDGVGDYIELRRRAYGFELAPLPRPLNLDGGVAAAAEAAAPSSLIAAAL